MTTDEQLTHILTSTLTSRQIRLLCYLVLHPDIAQAGKQELLADQFGWTHRNLSYVLTTLSRAGVLSIEKQGRLVSGYSINFERIYKASACAEF